MLKTAKIPPTVFIVDDDSTIRKALLAAMEASSLQASAYANAEEFLDDYDPKQPGCLVLDLRMPNVDGLELLKRLRDQGAELPVIVFSGSGSIAAAVQSLKLGAVDFLEKPADHRTLLARVTEAIQLDEQRRHARQYLDATKARLELLTEREWELLDLVAEGFSSKQIAAKLGLSIRTVTNHRNHLLQKTQALNTADLVRLRMLAGRQ